MVRLKSSRCWFFLLFVLHVQLIQARIEKWCRCSVLDEICCLDLRDAPDDSKAAKFCPQNRPCLCTDRAHFLSNPFLKTHPYFLAFSNISNYSHVYNRTPNLLMHYEDLPSDDVAYPNLLEEERHLRLLTKLRYDGIPQEMWSHLNESGNEDLFALVLEPKGFEILVALEQAGVIESISNLSTSPTIRNPFSIPYVQLINNSDFIEHYVAIKNHSETCRKLRSHDTGSSTIPGAILGILFVFVVGCILFCLALQRGMRKGHTM